MSWLEIITLALLLIGIAAGGVLVAQRPSFWVGLGVAVFQRSWPLIMKFTMKRMTPEEERAFQNCIRRGGEWDPIRKRCK